VSQASISASLRLCTTGGGLCPFFPPGQDAGPAARGYQHDYQQKDEVNARTCYHRPCSRDPAVSRQCRTLFLGSYFYFLLFTSPPHTSSASFPRPIHPPSLRSVPPLKRCEMKSLPSRRLGRLPADATHLVEWKSTVVPAAHWDRSLKHSTPRPCFAADRRLVVESANFHVAGTVQSHHALMTIGMSFAPVSAPARKTKIQPDRIPGGNPSPKISSGIGSQVITPPALATVLCKRDRRLVRSPRAARQIARIASSFSRRAVRQVPSHERSIYAIDPSTL